MSTNLSTPFGSNHNCSGALFGFSECLEFVEGGANAAGPNRGCCSGLGHVLSRSVTCLCEAIREGARLGVPVNVTKALALPLLCGLSYTPIVPCYKSKGSTKPVTGVPTVDATDPIPFDASDFTISCTILASDDIAFATTILSGGSIRATTVVGVPTSPGTGCDIGEFEVGCN
ncbi:non-specific lipid-transfer protein-like protein At5g64080 [Ananas comosus]|uniref:Non-specific lipid-transfer protein-like protein At5g64080 n=1 Tax=Ananas comosus TaxID=4615 RepID=A0A6P5HHR0_ANACO|nr:non-specific lipid-transfer protein-like protein At5g64080 [Ananas comosus]